MNKKTNIIIATCIVIVLIVSAFLFLIVFKDDKNKFIGVWKEIEATTPSGTYENYTYTMSFFNNNSLKETVINISTEEVLFEYWMIYKIESEKLIFGPDENSFGTPLTYIFSEDNTKLTLRTNSNEYWIYLKIS